MVTLPAMSPPPPAAAPSAALQAFQERFAALQRDWRGQLPQKVQEARDRLAACAAAPADEDALAELHRLLHTLAGSAGSFGLPDVGQAARHVEHELDRLMALPMRSWLEWAGFRQGVKSCT